MSHRFVRCPHCKMPHDAAERVCPNTGLRFDPRMDLSRSRADAERIRARMSELPPPDRRPEPLAFDSRARPSGNARDSAGSVQTRDFQRELLGQTVGGRYRIKGILGQGGMGTVYDAEHLGLSRQVAIKVLSPSQAKKRVAVKRFQQEARAAGAIGHPNICEVYDLGLLDDGSPYLVMEKLIGQTLAERISQEGGLPFDEVIETVRQVLSGLTAAHDKGIVHRDIKPENIFLARRVGCPPIIKLLDFGVSKMMLEFQNGEESLDLTRTGMVMGTPYYMSPEQARGERNLDGRVDVYACGVVMYEAIAGKRPFVAPNYNALLLAIINTTPRPLRDLRPATPPELEAIIQRAMERNRADRYPSAQAFLRDLSVPVPASVPLDRSGARMPAPPTAEERRRAPVLGGGRSRSLNEPVDRGDSPSAKLRARMAEARPPSRGADEATRIDIRPKLAPPLRGLARDDSADIPIHMHAPDESDESADDPTEIFRPGRAFRAQLPPPPPPRSSAPQGVVAPRVPRVDPAPRRSAPVATDDWEGETVVRAPKMPTAPPSRPPRRR